MKKTAEQLKDEAINFVRHPDSWRTGDETPPDSQTLRYVFYWIDQTCGAGLNVEIFPGQDNSIFISPRKNDMFLDIEVSGDSVRSVELQKGIGAIYDIIKYLENPSVSDVRELIARLSGSSFSGKIVANQARRQPCSPETYSKFSRANNYHNNWSCISVFSRPDIMMWTGGGTWMPASETIKEAFHYSIPLALKPLATPHAVTYRPTFPPFAGLKNRWASCV